jgi:enoyl-CoA hydratase
MRLPRLLGRSHALALILTGREVSGQEVFMMGLANRLVPRGQALQAACQLAGDLARFPQTCLRSDRCSVYEQWHLPFEGALRNEARRGLAVLNSGETVEGACRFAAGHGRHSNSQDI